MGGRRVGAEGCGLKFRVFFFVFRPSFLFFLQIPKYFVELRWCLRVFIIENVVTTHKYGVFWTSDEAPAVRGFTRCQESPNVRFG